MITIALTLIEDGGQLSIALVSSAEMPTKIEAEFSEKLKASVQRILLESKSVKNASMVDFKPVSLDMPDNLGNN